VPRSAWNMRGPVLRKTALLRRPDAGRRTSPRRNAGWVELRAGRRTRRIWSLFSLVITRFPYNRAYLRFPVPRVYSHVPRCLTCSFYITQKSEKKRRGSYTYLEHLPRHAHSAPVMAAFRSLNAVFTSPLLPSFAHSTYSSSSFSEVFVHPPTQRVLGHRPRPPGACSVAVPSFGCSHTATARIFFCPFHLLSHVSRYLFPSYVPNIPVPKYN